MVGVRSDKSTKDQVSTKDCLGFYALAPSFWHRRTVRVGLDIGIRARILAPKATVRTETPHNSRALVESLDAR